MIEKFTFGKPVDTGAVVTPMESASSGAVMQFGEVCSQWPFKWTYKMDKGDMIFGLGESMHGINKRGNLFEGWCSDVPHQTEFTQSLYGAHNLIILYNPNKFNYICFAVFFDTASRIRFDLGWSDSRRIEVTTADTGIDVYVITPSPDRIESALNDTVRQYRKLIGQSYIPPKWAFGFQQSRWGYKTESDIRQVVQNYRENNLPLDAVCMDIDYMDNYKDFTVDKSKFPDLKKLSEELKADGVHLVPIIDAGVKAESGYDVYEDGCDNGFFCKQEDGRDFTAGVWPGKSCFTDFLNPQARAWFGDQYKKLTDLGIDGFWNDMNEPALFYTDESLKSVLDKIHALEGKELDVQSFLQFQPLSASTANNADDYKRFYHNVNGEKIRHDKVHNLYGAMMTRGSGEALRRISPDKRMLLYSRASCTGSHRYGGIWTGDNESFWWHLEQEIKMLPGLNMAGYLYSGADIGGFGGDTRRELLLRWLALGVFTPLMRDHCTFSGRRQECYAFKDGANGTDDFKSILDLRYALIPYIYSEFIKAAVTGGMFIRPLGFDFPEDRHALECEDQLLVGEGIMIAPIYKENASSRYVYLPEDMTKVTWRNGTFSTEQKAKGSYYVSIPLDTVVFFVKKDCLVPAVASAKSTDSLQYEKYTLLGTGTSYKLYNDDGYTRNIDLAANSKTVTRA